MIATPDRTPPPRPFLGRPVPDVPPDFPGRLPVRAAPDGPVTARVTEAEPGDGLIHGASRRPA